MKYIIPLLLVAAPAFAQEPPKTIMLPSNVVLALRQYLGTKPYDETHQMIQAIEGCVRVQTPQNGAVISHGECPPVTEAMQAQQKAVADAEQKGRTEGPKKTGK